MKKREIRSKSHAIQKRNTSYQIEKASVIKLVKVLTDQFEFRKYYSWKEQGFRHTEKVPRVDEKKEEKSSNDDDKVISKPWKSIEVSVEKDLQGGDRAENPDDSREDREDRGTSVAILGSDGGWTVETHWRPPEI